MDHCPKCAMPAAGDGARCIFCGHSLILQTVEDWRTVYHPYSYADAMLATATLQAHGCTARLRHSNVERVLLGHVGSSVEVASDEHLFAQEVLRQLKGVRTDTEYLEWQELKAQRKRRKAFWIGALAAATASAALVAGVLWGTVREEQAEAQVPREESRP